MPKYLFTISLGVSSTTLVICLGWSFNNSFLPFQQLDDDEKLNVIFDEIEQQKELGQFTQDEVQEPETTQEVEEEEV